MTTLQDLITPEFQRRVALYQLGIIDYAGNIITYEMRRKAYGARNAPEWKYLGNPARDKAVNVYMQTSGEAEREIRRLRALSDLLLDKIEEEQT